MGENSKIEWTDHTFNPWIGCSKVSKGCMNCYAERDMDHRWNKVKWGSRGTRVKTGPANWRKPLNWNRRAAKAGKPELVFCASLADVFEQWPSRTAVLDEWRQDLFQLMEETPWLIWLVLTKRPENVMSMVPSHWSSEWKSKNEWPPNVWVGFSAEDQSNFDFRIAEAVKIPTPVLWVSAEPMLGPIDFSEYYDEISWWIVGGESGPKARPLADAWVNNAMYHCHKSNTPVFFKQWGEWFPTSQFEYHDEYRLYQDGHGPEVETDMNTDTWKVGRKNSGSLFWGKEKKQFPKQVKKYAVQLLK